MSSNEDEVEVGLLYVLIRWVSATNRVSGYQGGLDAGKRVHVYRKIDATSFLFESPDGKWEGEVSANVLRLPSTLEQLAWTAE